MAGAAGSVALGAAIGLATGGYSLGAAAFDATTGAACAGLLSKFKRLGSVARGLLGGRGSAALTVIGPKASYLDLAQQLGANAFRVSDEVWDSMDETQRVVRNLGFLDEVAARGDDIVISGPWRAGSYTDLEVRYLIERKGYRWGEDTADGYRRLVRH